MNCTHFRELLAGLAYDDLATAEKSAVESHLTTCATCREEMTAIKEARQLLDLLPAPTVEVDLARLYHDVGRSKEQTVRRWKRFAFAVGAAAAAVLVLFLLNLEVRLRGNEIVLRWGVEKKVDPVPQQFVAPGPITNEGFTDVQLIKDLIHALAADMDFREQRQRDALLALRRQLDQLQAATESYVSALHASQIDSRNKGEEP